MDEYIPVYPDQDDPRIQTLLSAKQEFKEVSGTTREPRPVRGGLYRHQKAFLRMFKQYDCVINLSDTGTGKTCSFISVAELIKNHPEEFSMYKHVYIFEKGPNNIQDLRRQITCDCSPATAYEAEIIKKTRLTGQPRRAANKLLKEWYTITTYGKFAKRVRDMSDQQIEAEFNGCLFWVDEGHNLRNDKKEDTETKKKEAMIENSVNTRIYDTLWQVLHVAKGIKMCISSATPAINSVDEIPRFCNLVLPADRQLPLSNEGWDYNSVVISQLEPFLRGRITFVRGLDTGAVPVYEGELIDYIHQINEPIEGKDVEPAPFQRYKIIRTAAEHKGRTIQVPKLVLDGKTSPQPLVPMRKREIQSQTVIFPIKMGDFQDIAYQTVRNDNRDFHRHKRQVSCFVFPPAAVVGSSLRVGEQGGIPISYGGQALRLTTSTIEATDGFGFWVITERPDEYAFRPELRSYLSNPANLARCSGKYHHMIETEIKNRGCAFAYSEFFTGSGAVVASLCFEAQGFQRYQSRESAFVPVAGDQSTSYCTGATGTKVLRRGLRKSDGKTVPWRYAILTNETDIKETDVMLELFNSPENVDGEYIKIIIGTSVARDGLNLFNVVRIYMVTPTWHPSGKHQALSRSFRAVSHDELVKYRHRLALNELRERLLREGKDPTSATIDIASIKIEVKIYQYAAYDHTGLRYSDDRQLYINSEDKDLFIRRMMRILYRLAWDCQINKRRNVRARSLGWGDDIDGSATCNYDLCDYQCYSPDPDTTDYSTYDILFPEESVGKIVAELHQLLRGRSSIPIDTIRRMWLLPSPGYPEGKYRPRFILTAIDKILTNREKLRDRFGYSCYIQIDSSNIYLQRDYPAAFSTLKSDHLDSIYTEQMIAIDPTHLSEIATQRSNLKEEVLSELKELGKVETPEEKKSFDSILSRLDEDTATKVSLFEDAYTRRIYGYRDPVDDEILKHYEANIFYGPEPWDDISNITTSMGSRRVKGRPKMELKGAPAPGSLRPAIDEKGRPIEVPVETVYFHTMYSTVEGKGGSYAMTTRAFSAGDRIRLFKPSENLGWRDANPYEFPAYQNIAQSRINEKKEKLERFGIYGTILGDGEFRIRIPDSGEGKSDKRRNKRGRVCGSLEKNKLIALAVELNLDPPVDASDSRIASEMERIPRDTEGLIAYLESAKYGMGESYYRTVPHEELFLAAEWYASRFNREEICDVIRKHFIATDRMYYS